MPFKNILDAIGHTPLVELSRLSPNPRVRIFAKLEGNNPTGSLKDRIAKYMIDDAEQSGALTHDHTILEPTSGNTGIALAMIGRYKGYKVKVVMPENVSEERRQLLEAYGAEVVLSDGSQGSNGAIRVAQKMAAETPHYFMPYQYGNPANPRAHCGGQQGSLCHYPTADGKRGHLCGDILRLSGLCCDAGGPAHGAGECGGAPGRRRLEVLEYRPLEPRRGSR